MTSLIAGIQRSLQHAVSGDKYRYKQGAWDLDLTYITPRVIAMGIPGDGVSTGWRNDPNEVAAFFHAKHGRHVCVFNLSGERYNYALFDNNVKEYPFPDHHPPPLELYYRVLGDMHSWLQADASNIAAVHCLAGRSRTGTIVSGYLLYSSYCENAYNAIVTFNLKRSFEAKDVCLPSQLRYVGYMDELLKDHSRTALHHPSSRILRAIVVKPPFRLEGSVGKGDASWTPHIRLLHQALPQDLIHERSFNPVSMHESIVRLEVGPILLAGDILLKVSHVAPNPLSYGATCMKIHRVVDTATSLGTNLIVDIARISFHTSFLEGNTVTFDAFEIDAHKAGPLALDGKYIPENISITLEFDPPTDRSPSPIPSSSKPRASSPQPPRPTTLSVSSPSNPTYSSSKDNPSRSPALNAPPTDHAVSSNSSHSPATSPRLVVPAGGVHVMAAPSGSNGRSDSPSVINRYRAGSDTSNAKSVPPAPSPRPASSAAEGPNRNPSPNLRDAANIPTTKGYAVAPPTGVAPSTVAAQPTSPRPQSAKYNTPVGHTSGVAPQAYPPTTIHVVNPPVSVVVPPVQFVIPPKGYPPGFQPPGPAPLAIPSSGYPPGYDPLTASSSHEPFDRRRPTSVHFGAIPTLETPDFHPQRNAPPQPGSSSSSTSTSPLPSPRNPYYNPYSVPASTSQQGYAQNGVSSPYETTHFSPSDQPAGSYNPYETQPSNGTHSHANEPLTKPALYRAQPPRQGWPPGYHP